MKLIGFSGYAGAGKDESARALTTVDPPWRRIAFADPLKALALDLDPLVSITPMPVRLADLVRERGWDEAKREPDVRRLLQNLGQGVRDRVLPDAWLLAFGGHLGALPPSETLVVVTDVRYPNEVDLIRDLGGIVVRVHRPGYGAVNGHSTETALEGYPFNHAIVNDGTVAELHDKVRALVAEIYS